jgi:hypothetical protein
MTTLSTATHSIMGLFATLNVNGATTFSIKTFSITTLSIMTLSTKDLFATLSINDTKHIQHSA